MSPSSGVNWNEQEFRTRGQLQMLKRMVLIAILALAAESGPPLPTARSLSKPADPTFRDFNGVNYLTPSEVTQQLGYGWVRDGLSWAGIEPQKGQWSWGPADQIVKNALDQKLGFLPLLAYTAPWAESTPGKDKSPPANVQDWEDFVEHVVSRYSSPPFNLRYFQVWNEPTIEAGFWLGTPRDYIDRVYLPAAKIIRRHNGFVVFGGWPLSNSLQQLDDVLAYHDAWRWTDILDIHYQNPPAFQHLYDKWIATGKCRGIWESEYGYAADPDYLPTTYVRLLNWALQTGWNDPNQYKLFWFASWGNAADRNNSLTMPIGDVHFGLNTNGNELKTLNEVLGGGALVSFKQFASQPSMAPALANQSPSAIGFRVGGSRIVIVLLVDRATLQRTATISTQVSLSKRPQQVRLVSVSGNQKSLNVNYQNGMLSASVARADLPINCPNCRWAVGYIQIDGL